MPEANEAAYRISGRFGEGFFIDPSGRRPPIKLLEATAITFSKGIAQEDVPLAGNRSGTKDGAEEPGSVRLVLQKVDMFLDNMIFEAFNQNLAARRAARDRGERIARTFTLQVWEDDPEALGAIGHQLEGVRLSTYEGGFDYGATVTERTHEGRFETLRQIKSFERLGNTIDSATGLPAIRYTANAGAPPR